MKQNPLTQILERLAGQGIPEDVDYRAAVRARLETSKTRSRKGVLSMNNSFARPRRLAAVIVLVVLLFAITLFITPQGRAWAQSAWRFFTGAESDARLAPTLSPGIASLQANDSAVALPADTPQPQSSLPFQAACGSRAYPRCSLVQIQALVDFPVRQLAALPVGWEFVGATGGPQQALLFYRSAEGELELLQNPVTAPDPWAWPVGGSAQVEAVEIGDAAGEYVQGAWEDAGQNSGSLTWNALIPEKTLRWEADSMRYTLRFVPAKSDQGIEPDKTMFVELAAHLVLEFANLTTSTPTPDTGLTDVAAAAGFPISQAGWLPERYVFDRAVYAPERNTVCLFYRYPESEGSPTLALIQSPWSLALPDILMSPQFYNDIQIDIPVHTEAVAVGGALNGQALYASNGLEVNPLCGARGVTTNHALLWQSGGKSFVLSAMLDAYDGRGFLTRLEMRRLAESLTGVSTISAGALDPEYLPSVEAAETLAGFKIMAPTQMSAGVRFAYAVYRDANAPVMPNALAQGAPEVVQVYLASSRDSLGRFHSYLFFQNIVAPNTLEEIALGGGEWVSVHDLPAVYYQSCWDETANGGDAGCTLNLSWLDEAGMRFDINAYLPGMLAKEVLLEIAESMR